MSRAATMLRSHPRPAPVPVDAVAACIDACLDAAQACTACADACLAEPQVAALVECVQRALDCADVAEVSARLLTRQVGAGLAVVRKQLEACAAACDACADVCERHGHLAHCRECADACRACEEACLRVLQDPPPPRGYGLDGM